MCCALKGMESSASGQHGACSPGSEEIGSQEGSASGDETGNGTRLSFFDKDQFDKGSVVRSYNIIAWILLSQFHLSCDLKRLTDLKRRL